MVRILLISHISPPSIDGGSKVIDKIGDYFKTQGHEVVSLSSDASSTDDFTHQYSSVLAQSVRHCEERGDASISFQLPAHTVFHRPLKLLSRLLPVFNVFAKGPIFKCIPFLKFLLFYIRYKPDYIIAGPLPTTIVLYATYLRFLSRLLSLNTKLLINASFHHTDQDFHNPLLIKSLQSADYLWTLTDFETDYFHKNFGTPKSKMINIGNGIDKSLLKHSPSTLHSKTLKLLFLGSFSSHKGIDVIIDSLIYLPEKTTLTLAGQPTLYSKTIETKITDLPEKIRSNIKIISSFNSSELEHLLDQSTILVSASSQESFGIVLLEAMARGIPVIGADIPATAELIKKSEAGLTFKTGDPINLSKKIMSINNQKDLRVCGNNGLSFASTRTWDRIGESLWQKISS